MQNRKIQHLFTLLMGIAANAFPGEFQSSREGSGYPQKKLDEDAEI